MEHAAAERPRRAPVKVTVLVTAYNHAPFLAQALDSVLRQRVSFAYEIVIGDDCSTDGTREIAERFRIEHPDRVRAFLQETNLGGGGNVLFAKLMPHLRGQYIAWLDGDDYWIGGEKLQRQVDFLEAHPECSLCFHRAYNLFPNGQYLPFFEYEPGRFRYSLEDIVQENFIPACSVVHRNRIVRDLPALFFRMPADWVMHILLAQRGQLGFLDEMWAIRRVHAGGVISMKSRSEKLALNIKWVHMIDRYLGRRHGPRLRERRAYLHGELAREMAGSGRPWRAAWHAAVSLRLDSSGRGCSPVEMRRIMLGLSLSAGVDRVLGRRRSGSV